MTEISNQFEGVSPIWQKEADLMDRVDQRRKDSGIKLEYGVENSPYSPDNEDSSNHSLYAVHPNGDVIGHIEWNHGSGEVRGLTVHPDFKNTGVPLTLLKAANDLSMQMNYEKRGIRASRFTTDDGYKVVKKYAPKHESVLDPDQRHEKTGDYSHPYMVRARLNGIDKSKFIKFNQPIEKMLGWE